MADILEEFLKERSDFQMLRLNSFGVGDCIVQEGVGTYKVVEVCQSWYEVETLTGERRSISFEHDFECHRFGINDVKDGDIVAFNDYLSDSNREDWVGIYHRYDHLDMHEFHCTLNPYGKFETKGTWHVVNIQPASTEQMMKLFSEMKDAGFKWDTEKKELRKVKEHYSINNFKPFQKVLVRDTDMNKWRCAWFSDYDKILPYPFITTGADYRQCIPFNGNGRLLGTTDMPDECYINW
ncbi:MAG: hypothetical protein VZR36_06290 [Prevotella sp.]|nr:hypothetical protein [Prevotella sp.]